MNKQMKALKSARNHKLSYYSREYRNWDGTFDVYSLTLDQMGKITKAFRKHVIGK